MSTPAQDPQIEVGTSLPPQETVDALTRLAETSQQHDGAPPFSEQTLVELTTSSRTPPVVVCAWIPAAAEDPSGPARRTLAGAAVVVRGDDCSGEPAVAEMVVHPAHRRHGIGTALAQTVHRELTAQGTAIRAWAHGGHPAAPALAAAFDWVPVRELWRMRLASDAELAAAQMPEGVRLHSFRPDQDEQAWLSANAAAFADHPEQGRLNLDDLRARMAEDWFDPQGFLLAWEDDQLLGFHWTKITTPGDDTEADSGTEDGASTKRGSAGVHGEQWGEVYAVGVVPSAQGRGLGRSLTLAGIHHLLERGVDAVILYVDAANTAAVELYRTLGFGVWDTDVQYAPADAAHRAAGGHTEPPESTA